MTIAPPLKVLFSPCPNDAFVFFGMIKKLYPAYDWQMLPIQALNESLRSKASPHFAKVSVAAAFQHQSTYKILPIGASIGKAYGPILATKEKWASFSLSEDSLEHLLQERGVITPGLQTTAWKIFHLLFPKVTNVHHHHYARVLKEVDRLSPAFALVIHESQNTLDTYGLIPVLDLAELWWNRHEHFLPLGCLVARKDLSEEIVEKFIACVKHSMLYASQNMEEVIANALQTSVEKDPESIRKHICRYVNDEAFALSEQGKRSFDFLAQNLNQINAI